MATTKPISRAKPKPAPKPQLPAPPRTPAEQALVAGSRAARQSGVMFKEREDGGIEMEGDALVALAKIGNILHTHSPPNVALLLQCSRTLGMSSKASDADAATAMVQGIGPLDHLESILASQMVAVHGAAVTMLNRALLPDQTGDTIDACINRANRLLRTFTEQVRTLKEYRTKGTQKVIVQHVHVAEGGQAVVGGQVGVARGTGEGGT